LDKDIHETSDELVRTVVPAGLDASIIEARGLRQQYLETYGMLTENETFAARIGQTPNTEGAVEHVLRFMLTKNPLFTRRT
jgi:hypothetical protein